MRNETRQIWGEQSGGVVVDQIAFVNMLNMPNRSGMRLPQPSGEYGDGNRQNLLPSSDFGDETAVRMAFGMHLGFEDFIAFDDRSRLEQNVVGNFRKGDYRKIGSAS